MVYIDNLRFFDRQTTLFKTLGQIDYIMRI